MDKHLKLRLGLSQGYWNHYPYLRAVNAENNVITLAVKDHDEFVLVEDEANPWCMPQAFRQLRGLLSKLPTGWSDMGPHQDGAVVTLTFEYWRDENSGMIHMSLPDSEIDFIVPSKNDHNFRNPLYRYLRSRLIEADLFPVPYYPGDGD